VTVRGPNGTFHLGSDGFHLSSRTKDGVFVWGGSKGVGYSAIVGRDAGRTAQWLPMDLVSESSIRRVGVASWSSPSRAARSCGSSVPRG